MNISTLLLIGILLLVSMPIISSHLADESVVKTQYGSVRGNVFPTYRWFQGIPFSTPPLGDLRWENPTPPGKWDSILDCRNFSVGCAQLATSLDVPKNKSEDCLYLDIYTPRVSKMTEPANVMMFMYGGDFKEGGDIILYDGNFMSSHTNTILVVPNYRVGNLGFLNTKELPGNVGLEDQRFALRWIQKNINNFGGNPNNVTLFGESAGGQSVLLHLSSPEESKGLFHTAIAESGSIALSYKTIEQAYEIGYDFSTWLGCEIGDTACIKSKSTEEVLHAARDATEIPVDISMAVMRWGPTVTGTSQMPYQPLEAFKKGAVYPVPFTMGTNLNEGILFGYALSPHKPLNAIEYGAYLTLMFLKDADLVIEQYPPTGGDERLLISQVVTDYLFTCATRHALDLVENIMPSRFLYQFTHKLSFDPWPPHQKYCAHMCCHGAELGMVFHFNKIWKFTAEELSLSQAMTDYWTNFGKELRMGTPTNSNVTWLPYEGPSGVRRNIHLNWPGLSMQTDLKKQTCDFWDKIDYVH